MDDPYDEIRATQLVPWKSTRSKTEGRQSVCQIGAHTLVGPHHAPVEYSLDYQSADRSETGRSSIAVIKLHLKSERSRRRKH